jgi:hypothetical protein
MLSSFSLRRPVTAGSDAAYVDFIMQQADYKLDVLRELLASKMKNHGGKLFVTLSLIEIPELIQWFLESAGL